MKLESITVENYRQFEKAELTFDEGITILAGANNSGKTSLINLIKNIFVDDKLNYNMSDIPAKNMREWVEWVYPIFQKFFRDRKTEENVEKDLLNVVIPKEETDSTHLMKMTSLDLDTVRSNINKISYNETPFNSLLYGGLGHNDLITFTKLAVDRFPIIKKKISDKYQLIFIDEYQDTSAEVLHIFYTSLVGKKSKLYLLGDKMQQIYKNYNGEFEEKLETFNRSVNLSINYRTTPKIVDILNYIYNDEALKQCPYEKNSNDTMAFSPKVLIVSDVEKAISDFTAILEACESLHNKDALKESVVLEIMEHEFFKESSSIERNSLLEYLISFGKAEETDVLIRKYLGMLLQRDHYYCALDVPALVLWKMKQLSPEYGINGMKQILDMHRSWRTAAGHIKDVELTNEIIFTKLVDWNESTDLYTLFLDIALLLIKSEDADVARTALAGVFATLRVEPGYINFIEKMWDSFHYRAKEWILMIYELLWDYREDFHDNMLTILKKHCEDEDFNVSLYSNLLLENYSSDDSFKYIRNSKSYFDEIPNRGHKLFIKKNRPSPWINGYDCVMEQIELLSERLEVDGEHLEKRVADYCDKIPDTVQLIKLGRKWRGCRVVCENPNRSFLRVLYKDWYNHKFDWEETELGRIVLSASEPYCLLITPQLWTYNNGYLLNPPESFISSSSVEQKKQIHDILFEGVDDTETVLAGGIIDYTHKEEIFGFMVSYFSIPGLPSKYAAHCYERNSRLLLQSRPDFSEQEHYNITLHHNGIESFQGSNIMCGFSKISLDEFHWHINITVNGMRLFNEGGQEIGRFEYYYGQRGNMGNRYISNQPLLQRWVVSKDAISKARCIVGCPNNIKINHAFDSVIRKYED